MRISNHRGIGPEPTNSYQIPNRLPKSGMIADLQFDGLGIREVIRSPMGEKKRENQERRKYYRIEYPASMRPTLKIRKHEFEVVNISEKGVMFLADKETRFGRWASGEVTFYDGQTVGIEGKIVRKYENNIGMFLTIKPISYSKILSEQRLLVRFNPEDDSSGE